MKYLLITLLSLSAIIAHVPTTYAGVLDPEHSAPTGADASSVGGPDGYDGADYGPGFKAELGFVTALLESNYVLALSLLIGIIGFWQFFVMSNGFGIIMIVMALGLTAFPGIYKSFYAGTRPFIHEASGATDTQGWK